MGVFTVVTFHIHKHFMCAKQRVKFHFKGDSNKGKGISTAGGTIRSQNQASRDLTSKRLLSTAKLEPKTTIYEILDVSTNKYKIWLYSRRPYITDGLDNT